MIKIVNVACTMKGAVWLILLIEIVGCCTVQAAALDNVQHKAGAMHVYSHISVASPVINIEKINSNWSQINSARYIQAKARLGSQFYLQGYLKQIVSFGIESRFDYLLHFDPQSAYFYQKLENQSIQAGQYNLDIEVNSVWSHGFFAQYFIPLSSFSGFNELSVTAHILKPQEVQQGALIGSGQVNADDSFAYAYQLDYLYDENRLTDTLAEKVSGWGHSFDLSYEHVSKDGFNAYMAIEDAFYTYYWQSVNQDVGCLSRPIRATCSVKTTVESAKQTLPHTLTLRLSQQLNNKVGIRLQALQWSRFRALKMGAAWHTWSLQQDVINDISHLTYESDMVRLNLATDKLNLSQAKHWQLALDIVWPIL